MTSQHDSIGSSSGGAANLRLKRHTAARNNNASLQSQSTQEAPRHAQDMPSSPSSRVVTEVGDLTTRAEAFMTACEEALANSRNKRKAVVGGHVGLPLPAIYTRRRRNEMEQLPNLTGSAIPTPIGEEEIGHEHVMTAPRTPPNPDVGKDIDLEEYSVQAPVGDITPSPVHDDLRHAHIWSPVGSPTSPLDIIYNSSEGEDAEYSI